MKRTLIGALVGALIIFAWQFLSFAAVNFHRPAQNYTPKQETLMNFLEQQQLPEGGYVMPTLPEGATKEQWEKLMTDNAGKPWAVVQYHKSLNEDMTMNMVRGLLTNFIIVLLFCWLLSKMPNLRFGAVVTAALAVGLIVFLNGPYTGNIWYPMFDIWAHLGDAIVSWGLTGIWLAWWMRKRKQQLSHYHVQQGVTHMAD